MASERHSKLETNNNWKIGIRDFMSVEENKITIFMLSVYKSKKILVSLVLTFLKQGWY